MTRKLPPRRLLAVAAALALVGGQADAHSSPSPAAGASSAAADLACPLGSFHCAPRPVNYAMCRPNALLEFYDPVLMRDSSQRDSSPTQIQAQHVDSSNRSVYRLSGDVRLERADQLLRADRVDYNNDSTDYDARGNVRYQDASQLLAASHMRGNTNDSHGTANDLRYQMLDSRGNGTADLGQMLDAEHTRYTQATYSTCDVGHHVWEVRAKSITIDKVNGVGVARDASMRIGHVPILYLPYFSFPIDDRRKSGFLYPTMGHSGRSGYEISTPYYLNLAPNYDATLDPRYYSQRGPMLGGEFRYLTSRSAGQLEAQYVLKDHGVSDGLADTKGDSRYLVQFSDTTQLWQGWRFVSSYNHASDSSYLYDFGDNLTHSAIYTLGSNVALVGSGKWWNASVGGTIYQNMNPFSTDSGLPYRQLPYANFSMDIPLSNWLEAGVDSEAAAFRKTGYVEGQREDIYPWLAADFGSAAWFVRPKLAWRYTSYQLGSGRQDYGYYGLLGGGTSTPFTDASPSRSLPIVSLDSGLVFDRKASLFGNSYTQTLEPRLYYLYVPYRNQNNLPLFNTNAMTFDYWQLFSPNRFSGADRQMDANNLTAAVTTRLLDESGVERLSASIGQIQYFSPQRVQLPYGQNSVVPPTDWTRSDYVAQLDVRLNDRWRLASAYQWSPNTRRTDMGMLELQRRIGTDGVFNLSYRYRIGLLEQYNASVVYPVSERWRLVGSWTYSVKDRQSVDALAGVEYDSCCVALRLVGRSYVNQAYYGPTPATGLNRRDNAVMFEMVFKGLGSTGGQIEPLLRRDILGYQ
ncbi:LPS assembly protein LptD [Rhodanobacter sp. AS-Z3]|uniref:LPS-assembly protein LptD n=1 Tax=Rhodanobacter sp. AS-Z3 TaxID=3031330 RepID=UPI0024795FF8|nr:LPS assembly protein LptD [Rhodanobacter sp. AS-Z3]WEN16165.1 LPS assembly protein LptD [Rhodanobacter sp. AS-Z3]